MTSSYLWNRKKGEFGKRVLDHDNRASSPVDQMLLRHWDGNEAKVRKHANDEIARLRGQGQLHTQ